MSYLSQRLPKDIAISVLCGIFISVIGGYVTALALGSVFAKEYPQDGQDGLGALAFGLISMPFWGVFTTLLVFAIRGLQYRRLVKREADVAFQAELLQARLSDPQNLTQLDRR